jgi:hypothetical protein
MAGRLAGVIVTVTLNDRLQPLDRGQRYEEPVHHLLQTRGVGAVTGGGTLQHQDGEVHCVDVEVDLDDPDKIEVLAQAFELLGAPRGSVLHADGREIRFGRLEGLGLYLNGTDLPSEVYATSDVNAVIERLEEILGEDGEMHGYWEGSRETALYFYGASFSTMAERIRGFVAEEPLCQRSRIVQVA